MVGIVWPIGLVVYDFEMNCGGGRRSTPTKRIGSEGRGALKAIERALRDPLGGVKDLVAALGVRFLHSVQSKGPIHRRNEAYPANSPVTEHRQFL